MCTLHLILKEIAEGKVCFRAASASEKQLEAFQSVVELLREAEAMGLIARVKLRCEESTGRKFVDLVEVKGGLTDHGEAFLEEERG